MNMALVTGVSKGLGYEITKVLLDLGIVVIGLSRSTNEKVADLKVKSNDQFTHIPADLTNVGEIELLIKKVSQQIAARKPQKLYVINNASVIGPIERMGFLENSEIQQAVNLNLLAPIFINNTLISELRQEDLEMVIINISSGAAERPIHGWSVYNATKAAINMHTKVVALEQENVKSSHKIVAFSPGIMDTDMQGSIREANEDAFAEINKFVGFKSNGDLRHPGVVAKALVDLILNQELINGKIYSINDLL